MDNEMHAAFPNYHISMSQPIRGGLSWQTQSATHQLEFPWCERGVSGLPTLGAVWGAVSSQSHKQMATHSLQLMLCTGFTMLEALT